MGLGHKLQKLIDGRGWQSAKEHARRILHPPRFPLSVDRVIATIDRDGFEQVRKRYWIENPGDDPPKYLELERWIDVNIRRVRDLDLDLSRPKRLLDLGCGTGYFLHICRLLGHDVIGLDVDELPMFNEIIRLLGVPRVVSRIVRFTPLPDLGHKFDVITGFLVCFNQHKQHDVWDVAAWDFFLDDIARHLTPRGCLWLELNREYNDTYYTPELRDFFKSRGAKIEKHRVVFRSGLRSSPVRVG
jgi:SAM-dependent methyltransferase